VSPHLILDEQSGVTLRRIIVGPLDTNCWIVHATGRTEALLVDPGDDPDRLASEVSGLRVMAIVLTHAHWDHVLALPHLAQTLRAPVLAHPAEAAVWKHELHHLHTTGHWDAGTATNELLPSGILRPADGRTLWDGTIDMPLTDGEELLVEDLAVRVIHTPGHTPGSISLALPGHLLTGDTLFPGGPGLTGWPLSDFPTIIHSVERLLTLHDPVTRIHPGHGRSTQVSSQAPHLAKWKRRGW
jgi:hydroxyacylglutathione hydrolase